MELWFLRHARTLANDLRSIEKIFTEKLSPLGIKQSLQTGKRLAKEHFNEIYISDTIRTEETVANMAHTHPDILKQSIYVTPLIREREFGPEENVKSKILNLKTDSSDSDSEPKAQTSGESVEELHRRAENFLNYLTYRHLFHPGYLKERNAIENILSDYFEAHLKMKPKAAIAKKNFEDYSILERRAIDEYRQREKSREEIKWVINTDSKDVEIKICQKPKENESKQAKKILVLTHSGFINQIYTLCGQKTQPPLVFNCSISIVSVCCSKTNNMCNGSCVNEPNGMASCVKYNMKRQNDISHTEF